MFFITVDLEDSGFSQVGCRKCEESPGIMNDETKAKKLKSGDDAFKTDEKEESYEKDPSTVVGVPMPVDFPSGIYANVKEVGCGSRHTIVLLGTIFLLFTKSLCVVFYFKIYFFHNI